MIKQIGFLQLRNNRFMEGNLFAHLTSQLEGVKDSLLVIPERINSSTAVMHIGMDREHAEKIPGGQTSAFLSDIAQRNNLHLIAGLIEESNGRIYNSSVLIGPRGHIGTHHKIAAPDTEKSRYSYGSTVEVFNLGFARIAMLTCNDLVSEPVIRQVQDANVDLICHSAEYTGEVFPPLLQSRAKELDSVIISANKCGRILPEVSEVEFSGSSMIINAQGEAIATAGNRETLTLRDWETVFSTCQR